MPDNKKRSGEGGGGAAAKKSRSYFQTSGKPSDKAIPAGAIGVLVTCDASKEKRAADELMHILEEAFVRLEKDHVGRSEQPAAAAAAGGGGSSKPSIADMIAAEVADLKDKRKDRFKRHDTGVRGTAFVEFPKEDDCPAPEVVVLNIARHVRETQSLPSRHIMRLLPVSQTCYVSAEEIQPLAARVAELHFPAGEGAESIEFAVDFEHRACDKLKRNDVIDIIAKAVPQPPHKVNLKAPNKTIIVQLVRNVCAVSVVDSYKELLRLNVRKLAEPEDEEQPQQQPQQQKDDAAAAKQAEQPQEAAAATAEQKQEQAAAADKPAAADS